MNGADRLTDTLLVNGVGVCFANPGTSEMHFVAALDHKPKMRCVLGLFEGVVTGAADGYARMTDTPAATLLHLGPGLGNGLANLHNARRARTPIVNIVGEHASYHIQHDAPLTSDIESLARPMSHWVGRVDGAADVQAKAEQAYTEAVMQRSVATLILPADSAWGEVADSALAATGLPERAAVSDEVLRRAASALGERRPTAIILHGRALRGAALETAGRIAAVTGAALFAPMAARIERGAGRPPVRPVPYPVDMAVDALKDFEFAICVGGPQPVGFFAYPGKPSLMLPPRCQVIEMGSEDNEPLQTLQRLAEAADVSVDHAFHAEPLTQIEIAAPSGALSAETISLAVARLLPEQAIICDESITSGGRLSALSPGLPPHDQLALTGGAIGIGLPLAAGAAIACPDRKVIALQADGSGMYTVQALWTHAREQLDIVTIVFSNRAYAILQGEMRGVGVDHFGDNARRMLDLNDPELDWCALAQGLGVEAARATSVEQFSDLLRGALARKGPFLIEALV